MDPGPLILLNGYPGVGKSTVASALQNLIPNSKLLTNHLLIDPVAALLSRTDPGYRELRKAIQTPILDCIATNASLRTRTIIATYYQETFSNRAITLKEYLACAKRSRRPFVVIILRCSEEENRRRIVSEERAVGSKLMDVDVLAEIWKEHGLYSFYDDGFEKPEVWEFRLDVENVEPEEAARCIMRIMEQEVESL